MPDCWVPLKHRLTGLNLFCRDITGNCGTLGELTRLTRLEADLRAPGLGPGPAIAGLSALHELGITADMEHGSVAMQKVLQDVRSTRSLKRLCLFPDTYSRRLVGAVGALTQLTLLQLHSSDRLEERPGAGAAGHVPPPQQQLAAAAEEQEAREQQQLAALGAQPAPPLQQDAGGRLQALHQLVGLRQLQLAAPHVLNHPTGWLSHLTQLTLLGVGFFFNQVPGYEEEQSTDESEQSAGQSEESTDDAGEVTDADEVSTGDDEQSGSDSDTEQEQELSIGARCVAAVVPCVQHSRPASLTQLGLFVEDASAWQVVPSPLPGVSVQVRRFHDNVWLSACHGRRPMQPCRHLPGVWEVLE
jgi:hypothetical protein